VSLTPRIFAFPMLSLEWTLFELKAVFIVTSEDTILLWREQCDVKK